MNKTQNIRLLDVFFIGPIMIYYAYQYKMRSLDKFVLAGLGVATVLYNGKNYLINKTGVVNA